MAAAAVGESEMVYELRVYRMMPGKMQAALDRFENLVFRYWEKHGINPVGFWTTTVGDSHLDLYHMLAWDSLAERERRWNAFTSDAEFKAEFAQTEKDGVLVASVKNTLLTPTQFSKMQ
jgi:hypothetical protein